MRYFQRLSTWADLVVIVALLLPAFVENLLFLRVLRLLRLLRAYHVLDDLRDMSNGFRRYEEVIDAVINLIVFIFVMSAVVFVLQVNHNPGINNYVDALYFTVSTLTTTGFGDIVMYDPAGKLLAVAIMVFGVALFIRPSSTDVPSTALMSVSTMRSQLGPWRNRPARPQAPLWRFADAV